MAAHLPVVSLPSNLSEQLATPPGFQHPEPVAHEVGQGQLQQVLHARPAGVRVQALPLRLPPGQGRVGADPAAQAQVRGLPQALGLQQPGQAG